MTERGIGALACSPTRLRIGPSEVRWEGDTLVVDIDEWTVPWPSRLRGTVRVHAPQRWHHPVRLAEPGAHWWHPIAPVATIEVALRDPALQWRGTAYVDANRGDAPLEQAFRRWDWSRAHRGDGGAVVLYDVERRDASCDGIALSFGPDGSVSPIAAPPPARLPRSGWGIERGTRCDTGASAEVMDTLTDAPFYARSLVRTQVAGEPVLAMHESLSLDRFDTAWVQAMLPFRMPRRAGG
jgi:carotenoid 1,2-hydratase